MATYSRGLLSGSTSGKPLPISATSTPGTTVHTAVSGTSAFDEVYIWATNVTGSSATITIEWGGTTDPGDHLAKGLSIPANSGPVLIASGEVLNNSVVVRAFSNTSNAINLVGYVNRIS